MSRQKLLALGSKSVCAESGSARLENIFDVFGFGLELVSRKADSLSRSLPSGPLEHHRRLSSSGQDLTPLDK